MSVSLEEFSKLNVSGRLDLSRDKKEIEITFDSDSDDEENKNQKAAFDIVFINSSDEDDSSDNDESDNDEREDEEFGPPNEFGVPMIKGFSLFKHQVSGIKWMKEREENPRLGVNGGILALSMGLGKSNSITTLCMSENFDPSESVNDTFSHLKSKTILDYIDYHSFPNLVVCSKTVAYEWKRDIKKFYGSRCPFFYFHKSALKGSRFDLITYNDIKDYKIIITTYETVMHVAKKHKLSEKQFFLDQFNRNAGITNSVRPSMITTNSAKGGLVLFKTPWNRIIADESHRMANPRSSTFFSMMCLYGEKKWCLSGTPLRNYCSDLYSQFRFCGYNKEFLPKQFNYNTYDRCKMYEFILYKEYKDTDIKLPAIKEHTIEIELQGREKEIYEYYHGATKKVYNGFLIGSYNFSNVLTLFLRLRQICVSPYTVLAESSRNYKQGKEDKEYTLSQKILDEMTLGLASWAKDKTGTSGIDSAKMKEMINILKYKIKPGEKTLVFTSFKKVIDVAVLALQTYIPDRKYLILDGDVTGEERDNTLDIYKDKNLDHDIMFISYKVGSEGLNLVEGNNIIFFEGWWSPSVKQQAKARCHRIGQENEVNVWNLIIKNSIEEKIEAICREKLKLIDDFLISKKKISTKLDAATLGRIIK